MKSLTTLFAILAIGSATTFAAAPQTPLEFGVEASTDSVTLPGSLPGPVVFANCTSCNRTSLRITRSTALLQGSKSISYGELTALAHAGSHFMMIYFIPGTSDITRIVVTANDTPAHH